MRPERRGAAADLDGEAPRLAEVVPLRPAAPGLLALVPEAFDEDTGVVTLRHGRETIAAELDRALDPVVVLTALSRGERLIVQREPDPPPGGAPWVVLGALRTTATPGVDPGDEYVIEARRVSVRGTHELLLVAGVAGVAGASTLVLRALGQIEALAKNITTRAEGVQKIIGRVIHLN